MKRWITTSLLVTLALAQVNVTIGQQPQQRRPGERASGRSVSGGGASRAGSSNLEQSGLKVGQQMPDVTIYDENGEKFPLSRVKGKHAVLVFGCLT